MDDTNKTKEQLLYELAQANKRFAEMRKITHDISERKQVNDSLLVQRDQQFYRANRAYRTLSACNNVVIHSPDEIYLLEEICRVIVEVGGYRLAWVGFVEDDEGKTVRPVAQVGYEEGYLDTLKITWADTKRGRGPTGTAIRTGKPSTTHHILTDPKFAPWREAALQRKYESSIALPIIIDQQVLGTLNVYAPEADAFDAEEVELLMELTGNLAYGVSTLRTELKHKLDEQQLLEFVLQKQRTKVLTSFIAKTSEKFEVPLSTILTDTHLLRRVTMPDEREEHIRHIEEQVDSITMLVNALTTMSRLDGGHELKLETVDLNEIIRVTVDILKTVFQEKNPNIVLELTECQLSLQGDYDYLGQVVRHILDNAIRYTPGGGTITVRSELVHNNAMIEIIDTGPGINEQQLEHVFERFYRTEAAENMPGFGLGLSIAKAVIERHEGRIEVQSEVDKGSIFRLLLPIKQ